MCGIGGIYNPSGRDFPTSEAGTLWEALSDRGTHASGIAWLWDSSDSLCVWKKGISSRAAVRQGIIDRVGKFTQYAFMHTRFTTQGSIKRNGNNHPVVRDDIILTHNGVIRDAEVFSHFGVNRRHEVDTEAIIVGLRHGGIEWVADNIQGSMSIAWVDSTVDKTQVHLFTNGMNPLVIGRTKSGLIVWASNLYHLDGFDLESSFNATPFKEYIIHSTGMITSNFISDERASPTIIQPYSKVAAWGSYSLGIDEEVESPTPASEKTLKAPSRGSKLIEGGYVYDEESKSWRRATLSDYEGGV